MSVFDNLKKIATNVMDSTVRLIDRIANKGELEAVVAACVLVAAADGNTAPEERRQTFAEVAKHPSLQNFNTKDVQRLCDDYHKLLGENSELGTSTLLDKIKALDAAAKKRVFDVAKAIANADGRLDPKEEEMLDKIKAL